MFMPVETFRCSKTAMFSAVLWSGELIKALYCAVDNILDCIWLSRDRSPGDPGKLSAALEYGLVPCDGFRKRTHLIW